MSFNSKSQQTIVPRFSADAALKAKAERLRKGREALLNMREESSKKSIPHSA